MALALALLPFVVFFRHTLLQTFWWVMDVRQYFFAYHAVVSQFVHSGIPPLWNPYSFSGIPLLGDGDTAIFYPPNWLCFLLPRHEALSYAILLQFSIARSTFFYGRIINLSRSPAAIAALAYMFGGYMVSRIVHMSIMSGAAIVPLLFAGVERMIVSRSRQWAVLTAVFVALQVLAGHPQVPVYSAAALAMYALWRALTLYGIRAAFLLRLPMRRVFAGCGTGSRAAGALGRRVFRRAPRACRTSTCSPQCPTRVDTLLLLFPFLRGSVGAGLFGVRDADHIAATTIWENAFYTGVLPLFLAVSGVAGIWLFRSEQDARLRRIAIYWTVTTIVSGVFANAAWPAVQWLIAATPVIGKLRATGRMLVLTNLGLALLAGIGLQGIIQSARTARRSFALASMAVCTAVLPMLAALLLQWTPVRIRAEEHGAQYISLDRPNIWVPLLFCLGAGGSFRMAAVMLPRRLPGSP